MIHRDSLLALLLLVVFSPNAKAQKNEPSHQDSLAAMVAQWHALPEASVEVVGLGAGARGMEEVPGALHVISAKELERYGYTDPLRVLRSVSGVNIQEEDGYGLRPNIGLRGSGSERSARITLMEDGILIAPAPYTAPAAYYFPSIARMASVEVLKGSSQIASGPQTAGGAINLVTTSWNDEESGVLFRKEISAYGGNVDHLRMIRQWKGIRGQWGFMMEGLQVKSGGFKSLPSQGHTGFAKSDVLFKLRWKSIPGATVPQSVQLKAAWANERSHETYAGLTASDFEADAFQRYAATGRDRMDSEHRQWVMHHEVQPTPRWSIATDVYATGFHRNWYKLDGFRDSLNQRHGLLSLFDVERSPLMKEDTPEQWMLLVKANNRRYGASGVQQQGIVRFGESPSNKLVYGIRLHSDWVDRFDWRDAYRLEQGNMHLEEPALQGSAGNRVDGAEAFAGFLRATWQRGALTVTPGVRTEQMRFHRTDFGKDNLERRNAPEQRTNEASAWLPGIGFNYTFDEDHHAFVGVHRGFIPPGSAPNTLPEISVNVEVGLRWSRLRSQGQVIAFHNAYNRLLGSDLTASGGIGTGDLFNGGAARTMGIEWEWAGNLIPQGNRISMPLRLTYTYTQAQFTSDFISDFEPWGTVQSGDYLPYLSPHQGNAQWSCIMESMTLEVNARYASAMRTSAGQQSIEFAESTDAVALVDVVLRKEVTDAVQFHMGVNNLFDSVYVVALRPAGMRPNMPRLLRAGLRISL